ncbi:hypothetical protein CH330_02630 [candidate division WOR-3 bacterium JGI_Cruoil_03_51_56]|uniref:FlgD/Vpr Ig-like domain-containing protein n=1 Tax=candidate division WOR-3 bacterium JGI_Cruoil_03_51_56 TaxID=1973747 RepID=A0A235BWD6_UNCW3|nr:MAG: hypothetical protein CH330_02630 [candidate division WOR-3 bacterium JGI_Cruoil_03_51_56]
MGRVRLNQDCEVILDIAKLAGEYAAVAELKLYQCYPYRQSKGGGSQGEPVTFSRHEVSLGLPSPTPFQNHTQISYSVLTTRPVNLKIYDVQGRMVKVLTSGMHKPGSYTLRWDGTDCHGKRVPAGAYFYRLKSNVMSQTRKVILAR